MLLGNAHRVRIQEEQKVERARQSIWRKIATSPAIAIGGCACLLLWVVIEAWSSLPRKVKYLTILTAGAWLLTAAYTLFIYCKTMADSKTIKMVQDRVNKLGTLIDQMSLLTKMEACLLDLEKNNLDATGARELYNKMNVELGTAPSSNKSSTGRQILRYDVVLSWAALERRITRMDDPEEGRGMFNDARQNTLAVVQTALDELDPQFRALFPEEESVEKGCSIHCFPCYSACCTLKDKEPEVPDLAEKSPLLPKQNANEEAPEV